MKKTIFLLLLLCTMHTAIQAQWGIIGTYAGTGTAGHTGDGGLATAAQLHFPHGLVRSQSTGLIYFTESLTGTSDHYIRTIDPTTGIINTIAGTGSAGYGGDNGPASAATLSTPFDLVLDANESNLYFCDQNNNRVRKIDLGTGVITTIAGNGSSGYGGDGVLATGVPMIEPTGIAMDIYGDIFISERHRIRKINMATGVITTIGGSGTASFSGDGSAASTAGFSFNNFLTFDNQGNLLISDNGNHCVREIAKDLSGHILPSCTITTIAGTGGVSGITGDGGLATAAKLFYPGGIYVNSDDYIFIADNANNKIRGVDPSTGIITTMGATGTAGFSGDGGLAFFSQMNEPRDIEGDGNKNYYISDATNNRIRHVHDISICSGSCITLVASAGVSYSWSPTTGLSNSAIQYPVACPTVTTIYTVTITDALGGTTTELQTVGVLAAPVAGTISGTTPICQIAPTSWTSSGTAGGTWTSSNLLIATVNASSGLITGAYRGTNGASAVTISYTVSNSCGSSTATKLLTVKGRPINSGTHTSCLNNPGPSTTLTYYGTPSGGTATWDYSCATCCVTCCSTSLSTSNTWTGYLTPLSYASTNMVIFTYNYPGNATTCAGIVTTPVITGSNYINFISNSCGGGASSPLTSSCSVTLSAGGNIWSLISAPGDVAYTTSTSPDRMRLTRAASGAASFTVKNGHNFGGCIAYATYTQSAAKPNGEDGETLAEATQQDVLVVPNPSSGVFTLTLPTGVVSAAVTITDVTGKIIQTKITGADKTDFDLSNYARGLYIITLKTEDKMYRTKIMIE